MKKIKIAVVVSEFNREITEKLEQGALQFLKSQDLTSEQIAVSLVPGAVEIPLVAKVYLDKGYDAIVAIGCVIRGETSHYEAVCNSVERGCTLLQIEYGRPVSLGVIMTENDEQAFDRAGGKHGNKGKEAAEVALKMVHLINNIQAKEL